MGFSNINAIILLAILPLPIAGSACRKQAQSSAVATAESVPKVIGTAFDGADAAVKAEAATAAEATRQKDPMALTALTQMMGRPDLTPEQRTALGRCLPAAIAATTAAAQAGDKKAKDALQAYNAGK